MSSINYILITAFSFLVHAVTAQKINIQISVNNSIVSERRVIAEDGSQFPVPLRELTGTRQGLRMSHSGNYGFSGSINYSIFLSTKASLKLGLGFDFLRLNQNVTAIPSQTSFTDGVFTTTCPNMLRDENTSPTISFSNLNFDFLLAGSSINTNLSYINIPIEYRYRLGKRLNLSLGPSFSVLVNSKRDDGIKNRNDDSKTGLNHFLINLDVGLGFELTSNFFVSYSYRYSFSDLFENSFGTFDRDNIGVSSKANLSLFNAGISYTLDLSSKGNE